VSVGGPKYKNKVVYLSSNTRMLYQFKELQLKVYHKIEKKKSVEEKATIDLFSKYLHDKKDK
jgi:hypothetical protein